MSEKKDTTTSDRTPEELRAIALLTLRDFIRIKHRDGYTFSSLALALNRMRSDGATFTWDDATVRRVHDLD